MTKFQKRRIEVEAVRYGKDEDGSWYPGAVLRVAQLLKGVEADVHLSDHQIIDVLHPTQLWDPPEHAHLVMDTGVADWDWVPLHIGDWVVKGVDGDFSAWRPELFNETFEKVE